MAQPFVSVNCGASGTTQDLTCEVVTTLQKSSALRVAAHLTCVDATREETLNIATSFAAAGVADIVALCGDPIKRQTRVCPHPDGFKSLINLISAPAKTVDFTLRVGTHPEAKTASTNIEFLKPKIDTGASEAVAQFSFKRRRFCVLETPVTKPVFARRLHPAFCRLRIGQKSGALQKLVKPIF